MRFQLLWRNFLYGLEFVDGIVSASGMDESNRQILANFIISGG